MIINNYEIDSPKVKKDRLLAVVSDLHFNKKMEKERLVEVLASLHAIEPSHIVIPGDLYNSDSCDYTDELETLRPFIEEMREIAPIYYVPGDSELKSVTYSFLEGFNAYPNFHLLCDNPNHNADFVRHSDVAFSGLKLPAEFYGLSEAKKTQFLLEKYSFYLEELSRLSGYQSFSVLLCHDPIVARAIEDALRYDFSIYFDLIIAGHNHGGTFPKAVKPILEKTGADMEKAYPTYTKGKVPYGSAGGQMLISSGITKFGPDSGMLEKFEPLHEGTIEAVRIRKIRV